MGQRMKRNGYLSVLFVFVALIVLGVLMSISADAETYAPPAALYELPDDTGFYASDTYSVSEMSYGRKTMGTFSVSGSINQESTFQGRTAYGVESSVSFNYSYDGAFQTTIKEDWNIYSDNDTAVNDIALSGSIGKGALIIQKSSDGSTWNNATNPVVDFFGTNPSGANSFYTTSGDDIKTGTFYRVIIAFTMARKTGTKGIGPWKKDVYEWKECVEVYEFYVCINTGVISIHNLAANVPAVEEEGYSIEQLKSGETLVDGSITTKGFSIDKLGTSYLVSVSKDGEEAQYVNDGATFTENGKYTVTVLTKLGKKTDSTIYVFNGGENGGYATYFGDSLVQGKRVLRYSTYPDLTLYPTYIKGSSAVFSAVSENIPALHGYLLNVSTGTRIDISGTRAEQSYSLSVGDYYCEFSNGESGVVGTTYHYTFVFSVLDEKPGPYINYYNINHTSRFEDLQTKHYEVAYQTAGGGYVFVCFALDEYSAALNYAYEIEKRFIEKADDGLYYKSLDNPNLKVKYFDYIEMTAAINYYASQNVEVNYFNATDQFTYNSYGNEMLESLESLSLRESIKVFASESDKEKLIERQPFINNFAFVQAADFDSVKVEAYCKRNGKTYLLEYGRDVSEQLSVSSVYTITETDCYGDVLRYDVYYVNENTTRLDLKITYNGETTTRRITNNEMVGGAIDITADSIEVISIINELDSNSLIAIKAPDVYSFEIKCLLSEFKNLALYKKGNYVITVIDRLGNSYIINLTLTGRTRFSELPKEFSVFTSAYNAIYLNDKPNTEELYLDASALKTALSRKVNPNYYTPASFQNYEQVRQTAQAVYDNVNATQEELSQAAEALNDVFSMLVPTTARAELEIELLLFDETDPESYTSASYAKWNAAYDLAKRLLENGNPLTEDQVQAAITNIRTAYNALVLRGDKMQLRYVLVSAKLTDCYGFTPESIEKLNAAFLEAFSVFANPDAVQPNIDEATQKVVSAMQVLVPIANFNQLWREIISVQSVNPADYTDASIIALKERYDYALSVYYNKNATQSIINEAFSQLLNAKNGLVLCGDKASLRAELTEISKLDYYMYETDQLSNLHALYMTAIGVLTDGNISQKELDEICERLKSVRQSLIVSPEREELYRLLTELENGTSDKFKKKKAAEIAKYYTVCAQALFNMETTEDTIRKSLAEMKDLIGR